MQNWKGLMLAGLAAAIVVALFVQYSSSRLNKDNPPRGSDEPAFASLIGKPAPDFQGDFAINGNPFKLSQFKGKVILIDFWAVWCGPCVGTFPHLTHWHNQYSKSGLQIVGVTDYNYESGKFIGFDKETGRLKSLATGNKTTEQAMLQDFARHHQLQHLLVVLPRNQANAAYSEYYVEGIPEVVLVDRKGIVRFVTVGGGEKNARAIEDKLVDLLAEPG